ncbi:MAG: hypothetical protein NZ956_01480 [Candidatus Caldarchaeum sp.]|nr:hypothetical protein [Candidatus Caldarchaeum sp.]
MSRAFVLMTAVGLAFFDQSHGTVDLRPFADEPAEIARIADSGEIPRSYVEKFLASAREKGFDTLLFWDEKVGDALKGLSGLYGLLVEHVERMVVDVESLMPPQEAERYRLLVREVSTELARLRLMVEAGRRDLHIVHAVRALDDLEKMKNQIYVRVKEWYDVHFPELSSIVPEVDVFLELTSLPLLRPNIDDKKLSKVVGDDAAVKVVEAAKKSVGGFMSHRDARSLSALAMLGVEVGQLAKKMAEYVRDLMAAEAPNLSAVAGPVLGSRLISLAGGLENLARLPASTVQVLGAEKALFRFLKTGRGAPKHGVIFQHPYVHSAPRWQRGKIARALATKISIAARVDFFSKEDRSSQLRESLEKRIEDIRQKYASPPAKKPVTKQVERRRRRR